VLNELMGLDAAAQWNVADALPMPVKEEDSLDALQELALARADLDSDRRAVVLLEDALGLTRSYRFIGDVEVGAQYERDTDRNRLIGPSLSLQLPIFNQGQAAILRAESLLDAARARVRAKEVEISNAVDAANDRVMAIRRRIDRLGNETIPLRGQIVARMQEQQNYMLVDVFDLLRTKQDEYNVYQQYLESVSDYWLARVDLAHAVGSRLPSDDLIDEAVVAPDTRPKPSKTPNASPANALDPSTPPDHNHHGE
jgi:cobalt-zinc-cadmium efflux system outer membrane protein